MASTAWMQYNGVEIFNKARTARLAEALRLGAVWLLPEHTDWLVSAQGAGDYASISAAPWYDSGVPASAEFAGLLPMEVTGLGDSTLTSDPIEYITDGGHPGKARNTTQALVFSAMIVASTERGAEFGKRWLDRVLKSSATGVFCAGSDLRYYRYEDADAPVAHYRDVRLSRGTQITRRRSNARETTWTLTWTMTAGDPYEYGETVPRLSNLGGTVSGTGIVSSGSFGDTYDTCPVYDYSPIYDPLYPALVPAPTAPNLIPDGWDIYPGDSYTRHWARITATEPSGLVMVPTVKLSATSTARRIRFSIFPAVAANDAQCDALFSAIVGYLPAYQDFYIDGEQKAAYAWDGLSSYVRRVDSLVFSPTAGPVGWTAFNDDTQLLVALDVFSGSGSSTVRAALSLTPKSD